MLDTDLKREDWFRGVGAGFRRSLRLGEFRLLLLACLLVSIALSAVGALGSRIEQAMQIRTSAILGADAILSSARPLGDEYSDLAEELGLETARSVGFLSMLISGEESRLVGIRAVSDNFPLRGEVLIKREEVPEGYVVLERPPKRGEVWAATQIVVDLGLDVDDPVQLGEMSADFNGEILLDPEGGASRIRFAPRVLMNLEDLEETGLVTPASRARYRLMVAGTREAVDAFEQAVRPRLKTYEQIVVADIRRDEVRSTVGRIISYIRLAVLLSVILSVAAMTLAAQGLWRRQMTEMALLRCLGRQNGKIIARLGLVYLAAGLPVCIAGVLIGFGIQYLAGRLVQELAIITLPGPSPWPLAGAALVTLLSLFVVSMPTLRAVRHVPPLMLLRASTGPPLGQRSSTFSILVLIVLLTVILAGDAALALTVLPGLLLAALLFWGLIRLLILIAGRIARASPSPYYVALKEVCSNGAHSAWIASTFGTIVFAIVLLGIFRYDIFETWGQTLPDDAPNVFVINIKESNLPPLQAFLDKQELTRTDMYAIIRGRIVQINGRAVTEYDFASREAEDRLSHEFNLTETAALPEDNEVVAGRWFTAADRGLSVEAETAEALELEIGDRITLDIAGSLHVAPVLSIREVVWENMRPNFFIIASPGLLEDAPVSHMLAAHVVDDLNLFVNRITREFPNVSAINVSILLKRFQDIIDQGSMAISTVFLFTLLAAALVFFGILQGQKVTRQWQIALLKSMGAGRSFIRAAVIGEFALLGTLSGLLGSSVALLCGALMAEHIFEIKLEISWHWMGISIALGILLVAVSGYLSIRRLLNVVPVRLLARDGG